MTDSFGDYLRVSRAAYFGAVTWDEVRESRRRLVAALGEHEQALRDYRAGLADQ